MENNPNNTSAQSGAQNQNKSNTTPGSSAGSTSAQSNNTSRDNASANSAGSTGSSSNQSTQGRSNQQATSGQDSMKNIQDMLQKYSGPIVQKFNSLSTTQKVVGGSLLALGAGWLAMGSKNKNKLKSKASTLKSTAKDKISSKKKDNTSGSYTSSTNRTGSSAVDARVK